LPTRRGAGGRPVDPARDIDIIDTELILAEAQSWKRASTA
jgi:ribosome-binding ATPase YchF (GTP1/OBG family)